MPVASTGFSKSLVAAALWYMAAALVIGFFHMFPIFSQFMLGISLSELSKK
jgi:hypothetical protein